MAYLSRILIYPIKSLEPVSLEQVRVLRSGALEGDRMVAFFEANGKYINGKRHPRIHQLRSEYDGLARVVRLRRGDEGEARSFSLDGEREALEAWLGEFFGVEVTVKENLSAGFPDDTDSPGPTVLGAATINEVANWFPGMEASSIRLRFRANLEISGVPAFWEERLYGMTEMVCRFRIGEVIFDGVNPCQRCAVPPRDPFTGENNSEFANVFRTRREATLPAWAERSRFNHFYRLAINTRLSASQGGRTLNVGDEVEVLGIVPAGQGQEGMDESAAVGENPADVLPGA